MAVTPVAGDSWPVCLSRRGVSKQSPPALSLGRQFGLFEMSANWRWPRDLPSVIFASKCLIRLVDSKLKHSHRTNDLECLFKCPTLKKDDTCTQIQQNMTYINLHHIKLQSITTIPKEALVLSKNSIFRGLLRLFGTFLGALLAVGTVALGGTKHCINNGCVVGYVNDMYNYLKMFMSYMSIYTCIIMHIVLLRCVFLASSHDASSVALFCCRWKCLHTSALGVHHGILQQVFRTRDSAFAMSTLSWAK